MQQILTDSLRRATELLPAKTAVIDGDLCYTYSELAERCARLAGALGNAGVGHGDRVAVLMANGHRYLETYYAVPGMGAVLVPMNNRLAVPEHRYILEDAGVHTLIADESHAAVAEELRSSVKQVIVGADAYEAALDLPKSGAGKILKRELRDRYWQGQDRHVN